LFLFWRPLGGSFYLLMCMVVWVAMPSVDIEKRNWNLAHNYLILALWPNRDIVSHCTSRIVPAAGLEPARPFRDKGF
jgi:hypothetical protein